MLQIFVNDSPRQPPEPCETWADLLTHLDEWAAAEGVLLSAARFDGVEEPSFRNGDAARRPLVGIQCVDVRAVPPAALLRECLDEAVQSFGGMAVLAGRLATRYRGADLTGAHEGLRDLVREISALVRMIGILTGALGLAPSDEGDGSGVAREMASLEELVRSLAATQQAGDWLGVADVLEYDLPVAIQRWEALLRSLARGVPAPKQG
jgi:hypothetical protein